uniref:Lrp/AsnC family transcriptional regulator n=1 Tax=Pararhizobium sp. IMCC3301 TaxID=3067904 RepID=UPI0027407639|nr:Lrp/AsnC family transcriptional regulator [Pararhizobium sp. IMCC3301]
MSHAIDRPLDPFDRTILGELARDARQSYADIGQSVGLSAPAVHERVKKLKASGTITGTSIAIDGAAIGKPFLAFVHVDANGWGKSERMMKLRAFPEVEELHSVTGDTCVIMKIRTENADAMEKFLAQLYALPGVRGTKSYVVLTTYLDRPVQAEITKDWPDIPLPLE